MKQNLSIVLIFTCLFSWLMPGSLWAQQQRQGSIDQDRENIPSFLENREPEDVIGEVPTAMTVSPPSAKTGLSFSYNVHVLGYVTYPGTYRISPSDRLINALQFAGGVLKNGSQRNIQLRRKGETRGIDLYAFKYRGNMRQNPYLTNDDVIFVPLKKGEIEIEGPVKMPGYYEIMNPLSLDKALDMAGGLATGHSLKQPIRIVRYDQDEKKEVIEVPFSKEASRETTILPGDVVVIPHILLAEKKFDYNLKRIPGDNLFYPTLNDKVYVAGAVSMGGAYPFQPSYVVKDYVNLAGPQDSASLGRLKIISADGKKRSVSRTASVNAGETIIVPSKAITTGNFVAWFGTLTSMALTTFVFVDRFGN